MIVGLLAEEGTRLLMLAGPTGVGKTRLALRTRALQRAALILMDQGAPDRAKTLLDEALALAAQGHDDAAIATSLS